MGYKIQYSQTGESARVEIKKQKKNNQLRNMIIVCVLVIFCFALYMVNVNEIVLLDYFLPGDPEVTRAALKSFADNLKLGIGFYDAVTAFCREIIENASY